MPSHEEAVTMIKKLGGKVKVDEKSPGKPVSVDLIGPKATDDNLVPLRWLTNLQTLVLGGPSPIVFVVEATQSAQGTVRPVPVELGVAVDELIEVDGDLKPGDRGVGEGNERLESSQSVSIEKES